MKARREPLQPACPHFDDHGVPASAFYGDVYHSRAGAIEQARHVFIRGNDLPGRWHGRQTFTVCETGFGLGNNFLALWQAWRQSSTAPERLHVLSFEAHPFSRQHLAEMLAHHQGELRDLALALLAQWPPLIAGLHRLEFEHGRVTLTLAFGKVGYLARQVEAGVDAFFLDGFSPRQNPEMWTRELFGQLVRIANVGATAATWCSAGQVRRELSAAGFIVQRETGFGGKRQMSRAVLRPGLGRKLPNIMGERVVVVGAGLAGASVAHSLAIRGHSVSIFDPALANGPGSVHEGHRSAAMTPALSLDDNHMSRLSRAGILLAGLRWRALHGVYEQCGSLMRMPSSEAQRWQQALAELNYPEDWARWCEAAQTQHRCGLPLSEGGIWLGAGALVRPGRLVAALLAHHGIDQHAARVATLARGGDGWAAYDAQGHLLAQASHMVLACAGQTPTLLRSAMPGAQCPKLDRLQHMSGQVAYFKVDDLPATSAIVAGAGYWLPADEGVHVGGSTYNLEGEPNVISESGFHAIVKKVAALIEVDSSKLASARAEPEGWAGRRVAVSDHLPVIGPVDGDQSLWLACAYGSRGLSWMTLAGEVMAAALNGEPQPLERDLLKAVRPR